MVSGVETYAPAKEFLAKHFWGRIKPKAERNVNEAKKLIQSISTLDLSKTYKIPIFNGKLNDPKYGAYALELKNNLVKLD